MELLEEFYAARGDGIWAPKLDFLTKCTKNARFEACFEKYNDQSRMMSTKMVDFLNLTFKL